MGGDDAREPGTGSQAPADDLSARLKALDAGLERRRQAVGRARAEGGRSASDHAAIGRAFRMSTEFVAGVLVGGGIGWLLDRALGISPWGLIVFLLLGFGAGILNVMRAAGVSGRPADGGSPPEDGS